MRQLTHILRTGAAIALFKTLFAYLDPGSGSLIVQLLLALIVGILATFRLWKARLLSLFGIRQEADENDENEEADQYQRWSTDVDFGRTRESA